MQRVFEKILFLAVRLWLLAALFSPTIVAVEAAVKDQTRIPSNDSDAPAKKAPGSMLPGDFLPSSPTLEPDAENPSPNKPDGDEESKKPDTGFQDPSEPYDINDIPKLVPITLTLDIAKRAVDGFVDVGSRYDDKGLYDYKTLEEFVKKTDAGKQLEADIKKYGFKDITEWNIAIMNVSYAYGALLQNQDADIRHQIEAVEKDKSLSTEKKKHVIASLNALIPSKENVKLIKELNKLPIFREKLNLLNAFE